MHLHVVSYQNAPG